MARTSVDVVGTGVAFPLQLGPTRGLAMVSGRAEIEQAIVLILSTVPGERPMRPDFGCGIHDYVFAPADTTTAGHLAHEVRRSLLRWEPRIDVDDVTVTVADDQLATLWIVVSYTVKGSYDPRSLVFPFYVIPPER
jgi:phage baseplate assembly protein W